jgi:hypothetical protein
LQERPIPPILLRMILTSLPPAPSRRRAAVATAMMASAALLGGCDRSGSTGPDEDPVAGCTPANTVRLEVGESEYRAGPQARTLCIAGDVSGEYVLVTMVLSDQPGSTAPLTLVAEGTTLSMGAPQPVRGFPMPPVAGSSHALSGPERDEAFDRALRAREQRELTPLLRGGSPEAGAQEMVTAEDTVAPSPPQVGDLITLNAQARNACASPINRTGQVMAVSDGAIVLADTARPPGGFTQAQFEHFAVAFDTLVAPVIERHFGQPTDLDGREGVILFFTPEVNRLTEAGSERFVGGFFYSRDLFFRTATPRLQACATSNEAEVLYLMVPDPQGTINGNARSVDFVNRTSLSVIGHEMQHLVNAARRLHVLQLASPFEDVWLNEGLSHLTEEILFFEATGLPRRSNLTLQRLQQGGPPVIGAVNAYHVSNLNRFVRFLEEPEIHSVYDSVDNLEGRGAAQQFLRYASDRLPQDDAAFLRAVTDAPQVGWSNLAARLGGEQTLRRWLADWAVAIYADDRVPGLAPEHRLQSWSHPSIFAGLQIETYPIRTRPLTPAQPIDLMLRAGGAVYARFAVAAPGTARVVVSSGTGPLPAELRLTLLRTR